MDFSEIIILIGRLVVALLVLKSFSLVRALCIILWGKPIDFKSYGKWAVITGATDGIGRAYADELANLGMNVVLVSRTQGKLDTAAQEIGEKHKVETKTIAVDFSHSDIWEKIETELKDLDVGVLINNVGMGMECPSRFTEIRGGKKFLDDMIKVNMTSTTLMLHIVLPKMVKKSKGVVVNFASTAVVAPNPKVSIYAASKAYVDFLSRAIESEYRNSGIIVQTLIPGLVDTKLVHYIKKVPIAMTTPTNYVKSAIRTVGKLSYTGGYWYHELQAVKLFAIRSLSSAASVLLFKMGVEWSDGSKNKSS